MVTKFKRIEDMPLNIEVEELAAAMRISRAKAYELVHQDGFPTVRLGKRILVPRDDFENWLKNQIRYGDDD